MPSVRSRPRVVDEVLAIFVARFAGFGGWGCDWGLVRGDVPAHGALRGAGGAVAGCWGGEGGCCCGCGCGGAGWGGGLDGGFC